MVETVLDRKGGHDPPLFDLDGWWKTSGTPFPTLAAIAKETFSIQPTSCTVERGFSEAGDVLTPDHCDCCLRHSRRWKSLRRTTAVSGPTSGSPGSSSRRRLRWLQRVTAWASWPGMTQRRMSSHGSEPIVELRDAVCVLQHAALALARTALRYARS
jgi:hypothetical protein